MKYVAQDISQVKKSIQITVPPAEVDAKIEFMIRDLGKDLKLSGFRPGKVPASMVEKRFHGQIYSEATKYLINSNAADIVKELKYTPVSRVNFDGPESVERGKEFSYTITFEIVPFFDMPKYKGIAIKEEIQEYDPANVDKTIERLRENLAEARPLEVSRPANDGEIAFIDFSATDSDGAPIKDFKATGHQVLIGAKHMPDDFESIIKKLSPGETGEGPVKFDKSIGHPQLADKEITVKVTLQSIAERVLPEINSNFASMIGAGSVEKMRESIENTQKNSLKQVAIEETKTKLVDELLTKVDFDLPETLVENAYHALMTEFKDNMKRIGKEDPKDWDKKEADVEQEAKEEAQKYVKGQMFLLRLAEEEGLEATAEEIEQQIENMARNSRVDVNSVRDYYVKNDLIYTLEDKIKAAKSLAFIYEHAEVTETFVAQKSEEKAEKPKKQRTTKKAEDKKEE